MYFLIPPKSFSSWCFNLWVSGSSCQIFSSDVSDNFQSIFSPGSIAVINLCNVSMQPNSDSVLYIIFQIFVSIRLLLYMTLRNTIFYNVISLDFHKNKTALTFDSRRRRHFSLSLQPDPSSLQPSLPEPTYRSSAKLVCSPQRALLASGGPFCKRAPSTAAFVLLSYL